MSHIVRRDVEDDTVTIFLKDLKQRGAPLIAPPVRGSRLSVLLMGPYHCDKAESERGGRTRSGEGLSWNCSASPGGHRLLGGTAGMIGAGRSWKGDRLTSWATRGE
jgi:hypothetical protein